MFTAVAQTTVDAFDARALIDRGALTASRGGRAADWRGLLAWCDPSTGRAARFALCLVRALPGMRANLRRPHASSSAATSRARALQLARACAEPRVGPALFLAAVGDHPWRKLYGDADDEDLGGLLPWRGGPTVTVPELLRATGRTGARGRPPAARDDAAARAEVAERRRLRAAEHGAALAEILATGPGDVLSAAAGRVALASLMAAVRSSASSVSGGRRDRGSAHRDGLARSLFVVPGHAGTVRTATWRLWLPGRTIVFHAAGSRTAPPDTAGADSDTIVDVRFVVLDTTGPIWTVPAPLVALPQVSPDRKPSAPVRPRPGGEDTYTLALSRVGDAISLRWIDSTESGSAPNKQGHRRFTIAFHRAASFTQV